MSSSIWTRCAAGSEERLLRPLRLTPWRVVEAQHHISTRKLVDSLAEHVVLEEMIDAAKPPNQVKEALHYLLATPFRYPPLPHGSRFGARRERGIWYGSTTRQTALTEVAYYRCVFLEGTRADLGIVSSQLTAFSVRARSARGVDLVAAPFASHRRAIASRTTYAASQPLGAAMRAAGVEIFRYPSARDTDGGVNIGVFSPSAFGTSKPTAFETWDCTAAREFTEFAKRDYIRRESLVVERSQFLVNGTLPMPALDRGA
jgi:hypothetical protein